MARLPFSPKRAELFLERLANTDFNLSELHYGDNLPEEMELNSLPPDERRRVDRFKQFLVTFRDFFPTYGTVLEADWKSIDAMLAQRVGRQIFDTVEYIQSLLRTAWTRTDTSEREVEILQMAALYVDAGPEMDGYLKVLLHALKNARLLKYCANPNCREPYFISRRGSYCSAACAKHGQRESKLRWWNEHGENNRKKRRKKKGANHAKAKKA